MKTLLRYLVMTSAAVALLSGAYGTDAFSFLTMNTGARTAAMGNISAALTGIEGIYNNPASLAGIDTALAAAGSYNPITFLDSYGAPMAAFWNAAGALKPLPWFVAAGAAYGLSYGEIIGNVNDDLTGGSSINAMDIGGTAAAAMAVDKIIPIPLAISVGASVKYIRETLDTSLIQAVGVTAGLIASIPIADKYACSVGVFGRNIGVTFGDFSGIQLPSSVIGGAAIRIDEDLFSLLAACDVSWSFASQLTIMGGGEIGILKMLYLRGGYAFDDGTGTINTGAGIRIPMGSFKMYFDYAIAFLGEYGLRHMAQIGMAMGLGDAAPVRSSPPAVQKTEPVVNKTEPVTSSAPVRETETHTNIPAASDVEEVEILLSGEKEFKDGMAMAKAGRYAEAIESWKKIPASSTFYEKAQRNIEKAAKKLEEKTE